jgi:hypothetical protein
MPGRIRIEFIRGWRLPAAENLYIRSLVGLLAVSRIVVIEPEVNSGAKSFVKGLM